MKTHDEVVKALIERSGVRAVVERMGTQSTPVGDRTISAR